MDTLSFLPWESSGPKLEAKAIALHLPNSPNLLTRGQDLAPSLAGSFHSSSF